MGDLHCGDFGLILLVLRCTRFNVILTQCYSCLRRACIFVILDRFFSHGAILYYCDFGYIFSYLQHSRSALLWFGFLRACGRLILLWYWHAVIHASVEPVPVGFMVILTLFFSPAAGLTYPGQILKMYPVKKNHCPWKNLQNLTSVTTLK